MFLSSPFKSAPNAIQQQLNFIKAPFLAKKKNYLPPDLIVIKWVTVQHIPRTFKYKDLHNEQNPPEILVQQVLDLWAVVFSGQLS